MIAAYTGEAGDATLYLARGAAPAEADPAPSVVVPGSDAPMASSDEAAERAFSVMIALVAQGQLEGAIEAGPPERVGLVLFATIQGIAALVTGGMLQVDQVGHPIGRQHQRLDPLDAAADRPPLGVDRRHRRHHPALSRRLRRHLHHRSAGARRGVREGHRKAALTSGRGQRP